MRNTTKRRLAKPKNTPDVRIRRSNSTICQVRECYLSIPANIEEEWRAGNRDALADVLTKEIKRLAAQIAEDYDAQMSKQLFVQ